VGNLTQLDVCGNSANRAFPIGLAPSGLSYNGDMTLFDEVRQMLAELGPGKRGGTSYDTAWVARTIDFNRELGGQAMDWLSMNQLSDGSWGAAAPLYYHDRVICTLAAMIALHRHGKRARDQRQIERGLTALTRLVRGATKGLTSDPQGATVGFEWIVPTLVAEAESRNILQDQGGRILGRMASQRDGFVSTLHAGSLRRDSSLAFTAEMAGTDQTALIAADALQESNGSVACSPSATAYFATVIRPGDPAAIEYLKRAAPQSLAPHRMPCEWLERIGALWYLNQAMADDTMASWFQPHLSQLQQAWRDGIGLAASQESALCDGELTFAGYELLMRFGLPADLKAVLSFEGADGFRRFAAEPGTSVGTNLHALGALRMAGFEPSHPSVQKALRYLQQMRSPEGFWFDSAHSSPFYATSKAVLQCAGWSGLDLEPSIHWILESRRANGAWGAFQATVEETAYALQALSVWKRNGGKVANEILRKGAEWLDAHRESPYASMWIGKCLYLPEVIVRSAVLSAQLLVEQTLSPI
jgi:halimadienyl-diphosphate synthase